ncbi:MAG: CusA/CzcA family heavy metal efflux RND transporter [Bacteroidia bacterium]|nr:CusA/CzcA family heavy metal efflux RND transporter [Bacteroidia bacterium]
MLDAIIRFSIRNKLIIGIFTLALIAWGSYSVTQLPIDAVPDITNNQVQIITIAPSQAAQDIERLVTFPIEQAVATIYGIYEVRSFSRFGLSTVTVVFKDHIDPYWARQQIAERLNNARDLIPAGIGIPILAPLSSGLGEIYQYTIHEKKGSDKKYSALDLRTIQDWIVRRQLLGVEGIADVSSFGGKLKQYEISLNPDKLKGMNITINEIFTALKKNNQNTGGAYIDKKPNAYYIRSEGLIETLDDIENIVVKNMQNGIPVLIRDVAHVQLGNAIRYGAMTYNADGEVVGGIVMMLKGANSSKVIGNVKERIKQIEKTLPEGLAIEPFIDRTKLVNSAINTVTKNLAEGALIVIFILVIFLGNFRAGIIVASVIPLAMLFAVSLMNVFGVSGNLMSLGALDFGLIIDGAVIIVEATMHHLGLRGINRKLTQPEMDDEVFESASKIRNSAAFGEIIILIVYLPILALVGIEGKMFKPMAQTVSFAIIGAFILSLTYVPMISALFLNKNISSKKTFSDKMMEKIYAWYKPLISYSLNKSKLIIGMAVIIFVFSLFLFNRLGAEFIPSLDEGDFAVETRVLTGSSLSETIEAASKAAKILLKEFPDEVKEVVGKIGSSEIPSDPMPIEACDLMVMLKPKEEWKKANSGNELANKMGEALVDIPGVTFSFQQPIQMRFNELMSGARQDVVIKVYGEDLDMLTSYGEKIGKILPAIEGAVDIYVEKVTGLPQIIIKYKRDQIAKFGMNIEDINQTINAAFAGQSAGLVYEKEKRFDLVVRLDLNSRQGIEDVRQLYVNTPAGLQIPLQQVADVSFVIGPNQIQRDDAKRRIIIGFNIRGRDVESIVNELKDKIDTKIKFAPGYYVTYGGTFKNLEEARSRLIIAVPVSLLLILILLYFTFGSIIQSLLIFTAIPLSAIGGILGLWVRDMPFSISAGVGFIALFGVAVLNGIVLIGEFNRLKKNGITDLQEIILKGTQIRLRPVIMTACVASLGFLPMALSHGAGAEVQKPLATVVIGGLITATLLTLIVLPCLYLLIGKRKNLTSKIPLTVILFLVCLVFKTKNVAAQNIPVSLESAISIAIENNKGLKAVYKEKMIFEYQKKMATELPKTDVSLLYGQYNGFYKQDNNFAVTQIIPFPTVFIAKSALGNERIKSAEYKIAFTQNELIYRVKNVYYNLIYLQLLEGMLLQQDSVYKDFSRAASLKYKVGESTLLEKMAAESRMQEIANRILNNAAEIKQKQTEFQFLLNTDRNYIIGEFVKNELLLSSKTDSNQIQLNPYLNFLKQQVAIAEKEKSVAVNSSLPDFKIGYFNQSLYGVPLSDVNMQFAGASNRFQGLHVGVIFPLWFAPDVAKAKSFKAQALTAELNFQYQEMNIQNQFKQIVLNYIKSRNSLNYYNNTALPNVNLISRQSQIAYAKGELSYTEYLLSQQQVISIRENYLQTLNEYNQAIINIEFYTGNYNK